MVDDDRYCIDVLTQITAIQAALDKVSLGLLDGHARVCMAREPDSTVAEQQVDELMEQSVACCAADPTGRLG